MSEFGDSIVNSTDEYRLKYQHEVAENKKLEFENQNQQSTIEKLQQQLAAMEKQLNEKQSQVLEEKLQNKVLEKKLQTQTQTSNNLKQECEEKDKEIARVNRECAVHKERAGKMTVMFGKLLGEVEKTNKVQVIHAHKIESLERRLQDQDVDLKQKQVVNEMLSKQVTDLVDMCEEAGAKLDEDARKINDLEKIVGEQKKTIKLYDQFEARFQDRERKIMLKLENLEMYQQAKAENRCFAGFRRPSQGQWLVKSLSLLFVKNLASGVKQQETSDFTERLV